jgi:hypothetical protein
LSFDPLDPANVVYIAGPMTGLPDFNYPAFGFAARQLRNYYQTVLNPAEHFDGDQTRTHQEYLREALRAVTQSDMIVLLDGWGMSKGVEAELSAAKAMGIQAYLFEEVFEVLIDGAGEPEPVNFEARLLVSPRADVLNEARDLITGDRNNQYGPPEQDFVRTARLWSALGLAGPGGRDIIGSDVALAMACLKMSRLAWNRDKRDSWVDGAGYFACGYEVSRIEQGQPNG